MACPIPRRMGFAFFADGFCFKEDVMELLINGEATRALPGLTVLDLLEQRDLQPQVLVVERNLVLVPRDDFAATVLEPGDSLEIVHFVGGG